MVGGSFPDLIFSATSGLYRDGNILNGCHGREAGVKKHEGFFCTPSRAPRPSHFRAPPVDLTHRQARIPWDPKSPLRHRVLCTFRGFTWPSVRNDSWPTSKEWFLPYEGGRSRCGFCQLRFRPTSGELGRFWCDFDQFPATSANSGTISTNFGRMAASGASSTDFRRIWLMLGEMSANQGRFGRFCPEFGQIWANLTTPRSISANFGRTRLLLARFRPISVEIDQVGCEFDHFCANLDAISAKLRSTFARVWLNVAPFRPVPGDFVQFLRDFGRFRGDIFAGSLGRVASTRDRARRRRARLASGSRRGFGA